MSIVAVHGPNTFGSRGVQETGPVIANVNPTNGLKWDFKLDQQTTRSNQDFSWAFPPDGTPTPQLLADPTEVTYAAVGAVFGDPTRPTQPTKTATLTVTNTAKTVLNKQLTSNVATVNTTAAHGFIPGQIVTITGAIGAPFLGTWTLITATASTMTFACVAADVGLTVVGGTVTSAATQYPAAGAYPVVVPVATGAGPSAGLQSAPPEGELPPEEYNPDDHTVNEVEQYVADHPEELETVYEAEIAGKNRVTLVTWLEEFEA